MTAVAVLQLRDEGLLELDHPIGRYVPETGYAAATLRTLLSHTSGMQSEPVGSWWERSPGTDFDALVARQRRLRRGRRTGGVLPLHQPRLRAARGGRGPAPRRHLVGRRARPAPRPARHDPDDVPSRGPAAQGYSVDHFAGTLTPEPHQDTGAMAPAGQAWSTVADLARWARFLADGHPDVLAADTLREMASTPGAGGAVRARPAGGGAGRAAAGRARRDDARLHGRHLRRPRAAGRRGRAVQRDHRALLRDGPGDVPGSDP